MGQTPLVVDADRAREGQADRPVIDVAVGVLIDATAPTIPAFFDTPYGPVMMLTATVLQPAELGAIGEAEDRAGARAARGLGRGNGGSGARGDGLWRQRDFGLFAA